MKRAHEIWKIQSQLIAQLEQCITKRSQEERRSVAFKSKVREKVRQKICLGLSIHYDKDILGAQQHIHLRFGYRIAI